jgi:ribosome assembly protein 4
MGTLDEFMCTFRGHVGPVYQIAWSADSRFLVSASKDSTLKVMGYQNEKADEGSYLVMLIKSMR